MPTFMPTMRLRFTGFLLAALLCCAPAPRAIAGPQTVHLIIGDTLDEQGKPKPLSPIKRKLLEALERELGVTFELHMSPWARAERYAIDGAGLIFGLPKSADRLHALRYSDVAAYNNLWIVTRSDATFTYNRIEDLRGKAIGIVRGYHYGEQVERARASKLFRTDEDIASRGTRLTRLMLKRVDAVLLYQPSLQTARDVETEINAYMAPRLRHIGAAANAGYSVLPQPVATDAGVFFAIARNRDDGIIDRINAALARLQQRGPN
ncbi:substrate-binding periplasmic protein [Duganella radicis]|nr:transporter substrate-binding domain-containing protein [Duganella radicis]